MAFWEQWKCSSIVRVQFFIFRINTDPVWNRLIDFFRYYSRDFMYNNGVASIRAGLLKKDSKGWQNDVCIVHPLVWNAVLKLCHSYLRDTTMLEKETGSASRYVFFTPTNFVFLLPCMSGSIWGWLQRCSLRDQGWSLHCKHKRSLWNRLFSSDGYFYRYVVNLCVHPESLRLVLIGPLLLWPNFAKKGKMRN